MFKVGKMKNLVLVMMMLVGTWPMPEATIDVPYSTAIMYNITPPLQGQVQLPVYYVYPEMSMMSMITRVPTAPSNINYLVSKEESDQLLQKALNQAWEEYGPKAKQQRVELVSNPGVPGDYVYRDVAYAYQANNQEHSFQPWESEWDHHVTLQPPANREVLQPGFFNRLLASYIDFEVNYHEVADFVRRAVFVIFIGVLVLLWISMGVYLGIVPLKWLYFLGVGRKVDVERRVGDGGNDLMSEITDRIFLALDGDWLKKLEERLKKDGNRNWLKTNVQCCILPDAKTKGMADCQLVLKQARKESTFKCLTDLIYNFQFGPTVTNNE